MNGNHEHTGRERADRFRNDTGAIVAEYGLTTFLIAILLISAVAFFGDSVNLLYTSIVDALPF